MVLQAAYAHNAQPLSPTGSDNTRIEIDPSSSSSSSMILQQQQQQQGSSPQRDSELASSAPPPFLTKTYDMIDDPSTDATVSWTTKGTSFVVWNPLEFSRDLLPRYFKHNNFSSFVRQLNTYGFRKVDPDRCEFANEGFRRGQRHLLKNIHRKKPTAQGAGGNHPGSEHGKAGLEGEVERLNRDKNVLMLELVRLRQQQQTTERELQSMGQRLHSTEQRQQHMISFMAKAIRSPGFLASIVHQSEGGGGSPYLTSKRRKLELCRSDAGEDDDLIGGQIVRYDPQNESTRARLIEFFSRPDLGSKLEVVPLEALVRELLPMEDNNFGASSAVATATATAGVVEIEEQQSSMRVITAQRQQQQQQHALPISLEERLSVAVTELSAHSPIDVPPTPPLDLSLEAKEVDEVSNPALTPEAEATSSMATSASSGACDKLNPANSGTSLFKLVGEMNASVDSGAVGVGMNNGFWEQFLEPDSGGNLNLKRSVSAASTLPWWVTTGGRPQDQRHQPVEHPD